MSNQLYPYGVTAIGERTEYYATTGENVTPFRLTKLVMAEDKDAAIYVMKLHLKDIESEADEHIWHYIDEWEVEEPLIQKQYDDGYDYD